MGLAQRSLVTPCLFLYLFIYLSSFADVVHPEDIPGLCWGWTSASGALFRAKERDMGWPSFFEWCPLLFSSRAFIPWVIHTARWKMQSQLNIPSGITFIDIRFLPAKVLFSVHHLLFWRPVDIPWPPFDKGWSARTPEQWFFLKVIFLKKFLACITLKV